MKAAIMHLDLPGTNWHANVLKNFTYRCLPELGIDCKLIFQGEKYPQPSDVDLVDISEWCNKWHQEVANKYYVPLVCSTEEGSVTALGNYLRVNNINVDFMLSRISHFVARSSWTRDMLVSFGIDRTKISVIPYGADLDSFKPACKEPEEPSFLYVGSINKQKGVHHLMNAYLKITRRTDWKLRLCAGEFNNDAGLLKNIEALAKENSGIQLIPFPPLSQLPGVYHNSKCFCFPQDFSTPAQFSTPSVWGCSCGLPLISLDTGALRDYIINGENGFLCRNVEEFAEKMLAITKMDWKEMGKVSRTLMEKNHSPYNVASRYREVYVAVTET